MFPLVAIGGVIGAVMSVAKGASWVSDHLGSAKTTASAGGKAAPASTAPASAAKPSQFEAALAAQAAGQSVPVSATTTPASGGLPASQSSSLPANQYGTDYDSLARMKAGVVAYSHVGEHRGGHRSQRTTSSDDKPVTQT